MLSWLKRRPNPVRRQPDLEEELRRIADEATNASDSVRGRLYNRAGDLCTADGLTRRGIVYYGRAVDAYLAAGYLGPAAAMCRKILRNSPEAVRAHCTLACLAAHERDSTRVKAEIRFFVEASRKTRTERLTIPRLRLIGEAVRDPAVKRYVAGQLHELGDPVGANRLSATLARPAAAEPGYTPDEEQWEKLVLAAALDPDELWKFA